MLFVFLLLYHKNVRTVTVHVVTPLHFVGSVKYNPMTEGLLSTLVFLGLMLAIYYPLKAKFLKEYSSPDTDDETKFRDVFWVAIGSMFLVLMIMKLFSLI